MTVQATVGGAVLGTAVGVGSASPEVSTPFVAQGVQTLAATGASSTLLMATMAMLLIMTGLLLVGLARRHDGVWFDDVGGLDMALTP